MTRGILYLTWGTYDKALLKRSTDSADRYGYEWVHRHLDVKETGLDNKKFIYDQSPFDITCFLDIDTVIKNPIDYGFEMAKKHGLACCIAPASSAWHASPKSFRSEIDYDLPQLNTGVIFFRQWGYRGSAQCLDTSIIDMDYDTEQLFAEWKQLLEKYPESASNDQPFFSKAVYENINPFILPATWNWRGKIRYNPRTPHGDIKILHQK